MNQLFSIYLYGVAIGFMSAYLLLAIILSLSRRENIAKYMNPLILSTGLLPELTRSREGIIDYGTYSNIGGRPNNEDSCAVIKIDSMLGGKRYVGYIGVVADGAGGHEKGEIASRISVNVVISTLVSPLRQYLNGYISDKTLMEEIRRVINKANDEVLRVRAKYGNVMIASTLTLAVIAKNKLFIGHVGDSVAFLYDTKNNKLYKLTKDHAIKGKLYKAIGAIRDLEPDVYNPIQLKGDEIIILTSDGGVKYTGNTINKRILKKDSDPHILAKMIVETAYKSALRRKRKPDNITAVVIKPYYS
jgi:serine/threonine protein phosphatase PrpC